MKYIISFIRFLVIIIITSIIFGSLSYFNIISETIFNTIEITILSLTVFFISFSLGKKKEKNGYIDGLIFGGTILLFFLILNILFIKNINNYKILYYMLILFLAILGSILGINKKTKA